MAEGFCCVFQLRKAQADVDGERQQLQDQLAELMEKCREAGAVAQEAVSSLVFGATF